ncbi:MAG: sigma-E factor negative regulatory protein [Cellvibrionales bacterium]|nr:sigma-E factor negative regulatory protein [Cellvibrionales bacterium]
MSDVRKEMLSALFDGETSEFETQRLLKDLTEAEKAQWKRYQAIRMASTKALMNESLSDKSLKFDISKQVMDAIDNEPEALIEQKTEQIMKKLPDAFSWMKPAVGLAAAASVAFFVVIGVHQSDDLPTDGNVGASQLPFAHNETHSGVMPVSANAKADVGDRDGVRHFNEFFIEHFMHSDGTLNNKDIHTVINKDTEDK